MVRKLYMLYIVKHRIGYAIVIVLVSKYTKEQKFQRTFFFGQKLIVKRSWTTCLTRNKNNFEQTWININSTVPDSRFLGQIKLNTVSLKKVVTNITQSSEILTINCAITRSSPSVSSERSERQHFHMAPWHSSKMVAEPCYFSKMEYSKTSIIHQPQSTNECNATFADVDEQSKHVLEHCFKPYQCKICPKQFGTRHLLLIHYRVHTSEKPYKCNICCRRFTQSSSLTYHLRTHTGEKPFKCEICDKSVSMLSNLKTHMRTHTREKFNCTVCDKLFSHPESLTAHMRAHSGLKPYSCTVCDRPFSQSRSLKTHLRTHTWDQTLRAFAESSLHFYRSAWTWPDKVH